MAGVHMKLIALKDTQAIWDMPEIVRNIQYSPQVSSGMMRGVV